MELDKNEINVIGFDADDTLWVNESYFREVETRFASLMAPYETENKVGQELFKTEMQNLELYGYGIKGFILSMIETAIALSAKNVTAATLEDIIKLGKQMIEKPVDLLDGVKDVLQYLRKKYRLILLTKGDLLDQERKLQRSGLSKFFYHIEVLSEKKEQNYVNLLEHLNIKVEEFIMVGNSLKSDVIPLVNIGARAIHIPFHTTWAHEITEAQVEKKRYRTLVSMNELKTFL